ncbi:hypothetical protein [Rothia nasimurium]|nr:hypothetical protein [Rothia nasimurium]
MTSSSMSSVVELIGWQRGGALVDGNRTCLPHQDAGRQVRRTL